MATKAAASSGSVRGYWDASEEGALRSAVQKHGIGAWEKMRNDPEFHALRCVCEADGAIAYGARATDGWN